MAGAAAWTTCSWSGFGDRSSTRTCTCGATRGRRSWARAWAGTSGTTTRSDCISRWTTGSHGRCTGVDGRGQVGDPGRAFLFAPQTLSPGEGPAVRTRTPGGRPDLWAWVCGTGSIPDTVLNGRTFLV